MPWTKAPAELIDTFYAALPDDAHVERRKMFGYPCAFVNGNMFTGLHQDNLLVRLPEEQRVKLLREPGAAVFEPMPGRVMREYVVVPPAFLGTPRKLRSWLRAGLKYASSLPPKRPKKARGKTAR